MSDLLTFLHKLNKNIPNLGPDPSIAAAPEYLKYFEKIVNTLLAKRGKPKDQQMRDILAEYYSMKQNESEKVCDFAHRFMDVQTELSKLIPKSFDFRRHRRGITACFCNQTCSTIDDYAKDGGPEVVLCGRNFCVW